MEDEENDVRFGHDLDEVQDHTGVDLLLLKEQLSLSVEERFSNLERQLAFLVELRGSAKP